MTLTRVVSVHNVALLWTLLNLSVTGFSASFDYSFYSLEEIKSSMGSSNYQEYTEDKAFFGTMKFLNFNGSDRLFIGDRSSIVSLDDKLKFVTRTENDLPIWKFAPTYNRSFRTGKYYYDKNGRLRDAFFTLDGCLTHSERQRIKNGSILTGDPNIPYKTEPGPGIRTKFPVVRFKEELENFVCKGAFIRGLQKIKVDGEDVLWACGTFGSFPKAFLFDPETLQPMSNVSYDDSLPSCARWPDEQMATKVTENGDMFIASGWGLYRPKKKNETVDSTILYSDWRMLTSGNHWLSRMAMVLGRDVSFIPYVMENKNYLYFFGREVSPQFSYINTMSNEITQSFMLRICKNDVGYRYTADEEWAEITKRRGNVSLPSMYTDGSKFKMDLDLTKFSYSSKSYQDTYKLPTNHFASARKFAFGCYLKRYDGAQSLNRFWGDQNIMYFNRVADVDVVANQTDQSWMNQRGKFKNRVPYYFPFYFDNYQIFDKVSEFDPNANVWQRMYGAFSSPGMRVGKRRTGGAKAHGAVCQFQLSEWKTDRLLNDRKPPESVLTTAHFTKLADSFWSMLPKNRRQFPKYRLKIEESTIVPIHNNCTIKKEYQEFMSLFGAQQKDFYSRFTTWFQGGQINQYEGIDLNAVFQFTKTDVPLNDASETGQCLNASHTKALTKEEFLTRMKLASTAWPTEWGSWTSKFWDAAFHPNPFHVAGDNASFVVEGVEFTKMFVVKNNFFSYENGTESSPLVYMILVTTDGDVYRVVMCDLVSVLTEVSTCEITNTDQPYITKFFMPMRGSSSGEDFEPVKQAGVQVRISSLLSVWRFSTDKDWINSTVDEQSPILKDAIYRPEEQRLYLMTPRRVMSILISQEEVCKSYRTCVHCASDPECGWSETERKCKPYTKGFIQDVLNRGEKCAKLIIGQTFSLNWNNTEQPINLQCEGSTFFRGIVSWSVNGEVVDYRNSLHRRLYRVTNRVKATSTSSLVILPAFAKRKVITWPLTVKCVGKSIDNSMGHGKELTEYRVKKGTSVDIKEKINSLNRINRFVRETQNILYCVSGGTCN